MIRWEKPSAGIFQVITEHAATGEGVLRVETTNIREKMLYYNSILKKYDRSLFTHTTANFEVTIVDPEEIRRLGKRFRKLDLDGSGALSVEEFMALPELQQNPLVQRVIEICDKDGNGEVDFKEFIDGVSQFSIKGDKQTKLQFLFKVYDVDKDGFISNGELYQVLKLMVGNNLSESQLQQIVDKTFWLYDKDGDGRISFQEFTAIVGDADIHKKMVVEV